MKNESVAGAFGNALKAGALLATFALAGASLLALTYSGTRERIAENERAFTLRSLNEIVEPRRYDNDLFTDVIEVSDLEFLGSKEPVPVYRARKNGQAVAAIIASRAPDGYNGAIRLLVGVNLDGSLAGVRVTSHRETPGLGDHIELERSNWVLGFDGHALGHPQIDGWRVKRDGGDFDQFTGATITPRAVVKAVKNTLLYFDVHKNDLFSPPAQEVEN